MILPREIDVAYDGFHVSSYVFLRDAISGI